MSASLAQDGFARIEGVLSLAAIAALRDALGPLFQPDAVRRGGVRNLLSRSEAARALARAPEIRGCVEPVLGAGAFAVRGILFDKTPEANWKVIWHQDLTIAVVERVEQPGFFCWTEKAGLTCVQPPVELLERMLAVRIHLDDCGEANGPLRALAGTHALGRLGPGQVDELRRTREAQVLTARAGDAILMRPLLVHASSPADVAAHRRVVHLEFAAEPLPLPLRWAEQV